MFLTTLETIAVKMHNFLNIVFSILEINIDRNIFPEDIQCSTNVINYYENQIIISMIKNY